MNQRLCFDLYFPPTGEVLQRQHKIALHTCSGYRYLFLALFLNFLSLMHNLLDSMSGQDCMLQENTTQINVLRYTHSPISSCKYGLMDWYEGWSVT